MSAWAVGSTVTTIRRRVVRRGAEWTQLVSHLEERARSVVCSAIPKRGLKRFRQLAWFPYHGLVRARNGKNCPIARAAVWFAGLRALGVDQETAQLLVDFLQDVVHELWSPEEIDLIAASDEEARWEGVESALQLVVMREIERGDLTHVPEFLEACRRERAAQETLMVGLQALMVTLGQKALPAPAEVRVA